MTHYSRSLATLTGIRVIAGREDYMKLETAKVCIPTILSIESSGNLIEIDLESSSEDTFASYAIKMWGKATGDANMEARGKCMSLLLLINILIWDNRQPDASDTS
jgi:hypothetical protein